MKSFQMFFDILNKFPLYPNFKLIPNKCQVECSSSLCSKILLIVIFNLKYILLSHIYWSYGSLLDLELLIFATFFTISVFFYIIFSFQRYTSELGTNITCLLVQNQEVDRDMSTKKKNTFSTIILSATFEIILSICLMVTEVVMVFYNPVLYNWKDYPLIFSCHILDTFLQIFYLFVSSNQLFLMKNILQTNHGENVMTSCRSWSRINTNCQNFNDILSGIITARLGYAAMNLLFDFYYKALFFYLPKDIMETLSSVSLSVFDATLQVFVISIFLRSTMSLKLEVSGPIEEISRLYYNLK